MARQIWPQGLAVARQILLHHPAVFAEIPNFSDILFVLDNEAQPKSKGHPVLARVSRIPDKFVEFIDAGQRTWMLEWFTANQGLLTQNQKMLLMAHQLLHFERVEGQVDQPDTYRLRDHDVADFRLILDRFGHAWAEASHGDVADILSSDFEWGRQGQARLDLPTPGAEAAADAGTDDALQEALQAVADGQGVITRAGTPAPDLPEPHEAGEESWELPHRYGPKPEADGEDQSDGTLPAPPVS